MIGQMFNDMVQSYVSLGRIEKFMFAEEIDMSYIEHNPRSVRDYAIKINNGSFNWVDKQPNATTDQPNLSAKTNVELNQIKGESDLVLKNINLQIKRGSFVAILGE